MAVEYLQFVHLQYIQPARRRVSALPGDPVSLLLVSGDRALLQAISLRYIVPVRIRSLGLPPSSIPLMLRPALLLLLLDRREVELRAERADALARQAVLVVLVAALEDYDRHCLHGHHDRVEAPAADGISLESAASTGLVALHGHQHLPVRLDHASSTLFGHVVVEHVGEVVLDDLLLDALNIHGHVVVLELGRAQLLNLLESQLQPRDDLFQGDI